MSRPLTVAFVGCGEVAQRYLAVYRDLPWVRVAACIDTDLAKARQSAAALDGHGAVATSDFAAALAAEVDAVVVNTPNRVHREQAEAALQAGKHLLLQKPLAANLADAEAIVKASSVSGTLRVPGSIGTRSVPDTLAAGLYMSYFDQPLFHDLREMAAAGFFGNVVHCHAKLMHRGGMCWSDAALQGNPTWRGSLAETGGGCFIQLAVHYIHLIEWITGARTVRATGFVNNLHCPGLEGEDMATAMLELDNGTLATIDTAWNAVGEEFAIHGTAGGAVYANNRDLSLWSARGPFSGRVVAYDGRRVDAFDGPRGESRQLVVVPPDVGDAANPLNQHRVFLEAAREGRPAFVSLCSGLHDLRVVAAVYESARTGCAVEVERVQSARTHGLRFHGGERRKSQISNSKSQTSSK